MDKVKIFVACHKPAKVYQDDVYTPIQVGKAISKYDLGILGDDTGDNISKENPNFCELTAIYWAWKNMEPVEYIGLCHYRRYFKFHGRGPLWEGYEVVKSSNFDKLDLSVPNMDYVFRNHDIILTKPEVYAYSLAINYSIWHVSDDIKTLAKVIKELTPEYSDAVDTVLNKRNKLSQYNMMIMRWDDFQKYCKWMFYILFEAQKRIDISNYNTVQARIWGYMSERLLAIYVLHNKMKPKYYPIYWINDEVQPFNIIQRLERYVRKEISFNAMRPRH